LRFCGRIARFSQLRPTKGLGAAEAQDKIVLRIDSGGPLTRAAPWAIPCRSALASADHSPPPLISLNREVRQKSEYMKASQQPKGLESSTWTFGKKSKISRINGTTRIIQKNDP
jgi:hypothetical protein